MGYDHFALIIVPEELSEDMINNVEIICRDLSELDDNILFGKVHHLSAGGFNDYWWQQFDRFVEQFYVQTDIPIVHLYVCEFDGESLTRYEYINGRRSPDTFDVEMTINDPAVRSYWNMDRLEIDHNITIFYNPDYRFEYD